MQTISLCMIARDEEAVIGRCIESARKCVDEIIVVDTGSNDNTKIICERLGAKVFSLEWKSDFAAARNYAASKASGGWLLHLDADEELLVRGSDVLRGYLEECGGDSVRVRMTHFYGVEPPENMRAYFSYAPRILRNGKFKFTGKIHETATADDNECEACAPPFIKILHYGYMENALAAKRGRNLDLLLREKSGNRCGPWTDYYLAAEYYQEDRFAEAYEAVNSALAGFIANGAIPPPHAYKLKYDMLLSYGSFEPARTGIVNAVSLYPDYPDLLFYRGILEYAACEYETALAMFIYCLLLGETNEKYLILSGVGSFYALRLIGECHLKLGQAGEAAEAFRQASALCSDYENLPGIRWLNLSVKGIPMQ